MCTLTYVVCFLKKMPQIVTPTIHHQINNFTKIDSVGNVLMSVHVQQK